MPKYGKPPTAASALIDHPMDAAAWIAEKFGARVVTACDWSRCQHGRIADPLMVHLVTDSIDTNLWFHCGIRDELGGVFPPGVRRSVPTAIANFPRDCPIGRPPHELFERWYDVVRFIGMPRGLNFAAFAQPVLFVDDVRAGLRSVRA